MKILPGEVVEREKVGLKDGRLICGFPDLGLAGNIAAKYLVNSFKMAEVAYLSFRMLPSVSMLYEGRLQHPFRIYFEGRRKLAVLVAETLVPYVAHNDVAHALVGWADGKGVKTIVSLEGIPVKEVGRERCVYGGAEDVEELVKKGIRPLTAGVVHGFSGALMNECLIKKVRGVCLFVEADGSKPDVEAAVALLQALNNLLSLRVKVDALLANAGRIAERFQKMVEHIKSFSTLEERFRQALYFA